MIEKIWNAYIGWLLKYLNTDNELNQWKIGLIQFLTMGIFSVIGVFIFYYLIGASLMFGSFIVGAGYGRLFFDWKLKKYDKNYPYDKRYTPFLRFIATSTIMFVTIGGTFMLIKDAQENQSVTSKLFLDEVTPITKSIDSNSSNQKSNSILLPNKDIGMWK